MSRDFVTKQTTTVNEVLSDLRRSGHDAHSISYIYLVDDHATLIGVVDLREIILAAGCDSVGRSDDLAGRFSPAG
jgi:Mg/Co/Ni transporter MgtE